MAVVLVVVIRPPSLDTDAEGGVVVGQTLLLDIGFGRGAGHRSICGTTLSPRLSVVGVGD